MPGLGPGRGFDRSGTAIDHTIIKDAMPRLVGDLGASSAQLQWFVASYTIVFAGLRMLDMSLFRNRSFSAGSIALAHRPFQRDRITP